jgi:UDP-N-acetylglucosamine--N-acetylmuramyl-(pentapeptide) pyrophosphoryl-undecaprenol N-acetylglucosamine transferase
MGINVVVAGGGTAGHIEPAMNLADYLRDHVPGTTVTALGTSKGLETRLVPTRGYPLELIPAVPLPRTPNKDLATLPGRLKASVAATREILQRVGADVVVGFGGYVSISAYLAARKLKIPIVIHEANAKPGLANRVGARFTPYLAENYAGSLPGAQRIGLPLRTSISRLDRTAVRPEAAVAFGLDEDLPTVLVFGGSQGARRLNEAVWGALPSLADRPVNILHAYGPKVEPRDVPAAPAGALRYAPLPYIDRMDLAYAAADLAVCRSGAMTCGEIAAVGLPAVYVPFPIGNGEQRFNAEPVVAAGGGLLVDDAEMTPQRFVSVVGELMGDPQRLQRMSVAAAAYGVRDADARLAAIVQQAAQSRQEDGRD